MKRVAIQAGHKGVTSGATGAPNERDWNSKIVPMIAERLRNKGVEVYETDAKGDSTVFNTDWDLFLAVHYDADVYNDRGGFVDYPDASIDQVWSESKRLAEALRDHYFKTTGIPERYSRSNANTKFYYMWSNLTAKTPCVLIECGVGNRKPQDYEVLRQYDFIADTISDGVLKGLGLYDDCANQIADLEKECQELDNELEEMRDSRDKWRTSSKEWEDKYETDTALLKKDIENLQKDLAFEQDRCTQLNASLIESGKELSFCISEKEKLINNIYLLEKDLADCKTKAKDCLKKYSRSALLKWIFFGKI